MTCDGIKNVLKISMLYHARLNVEYTKINIIFQNEETVLENFATTIDCYWIQCMEISSTLLGTPATSAVIAHQDQKLADYIDDYYYQILPSCVRADERLLLLTIELNSISCSLDWQSWRMRMEWEGLLQDQVLLRRN
jgi:hypothetical protein